LLKRQKPNLLSFFSRRLATSNVLPSVDVHSSLFLKTLLSLVILDILRVMGNVVAQLLQGHMASSYVKGLQDNGVSATIKHFVANDQEHERTAVYSVVSERALREIYLYPYAP
jgi:hypothetical protein